MLNIIAPKAKLQSLPNPFDQNTKDLIIKVEYNFGKQIAYPVNDVAVTFCKIAGTITLTKRVMNLAKSLGYTVGIVKPHIDMEAFS
jgi:Tfp pilus assembly PilM family ATPase